nr:hypothetical protein [Nannocystis pusilla]
MLAQVRQGGLGQEEHREDVGAEGADELRLVDVLELVLGVLLGGVVDEDVEAAEAIDDLADGVAAERAVADVAADRQTGAALFLDLGGGLAGVAVLAQIDDGDVGALAGEQHGGGAADAAVAPGDERDPTLELAAAAVLGPLELRTRGHLRLLARRPLGLLRPLLALLVALRCVAHGCLRFVSWRPWPRGTRDSWHRRPDCQRRERQASARALEHGRGRWPRRRRKRRDLAHVSERAGGNIGRRSGRASGRGTTPQAEQGGIVGRF